MYRIYKIYGIHMIRNGLNDPQITGLSNPEDKSCSFNVQRRIVSLSVSFLKRIHPFQNGWCVTCEDAARDQRNRWDAWILILSGSGRRMNSNYDCTHESSITRDCWLSRLWIWWTPSRNISTFQIAIRIDVDLRSTLMGTCAGLEIATSDLLPKFFVCKHVCLMQRHLHLQHRHHINFTITNF